MHRQYEIVFVLAKCERWGIKCYRLGKDSGRMIATWDEPRGSAPGPLAGIRVLDLTAVLMGPSATQMLGDLGADVIKVEPPTGDTMRSVGPARHPGMGPLFLQANRNKRSVVMDLKSPEGRSALLTLAAGADVFVSNVRPAGMERLGLGYAALRAVNSAIIYCAAVGYGDGGPAAGRAVYDDLMQAASGISGLFAAIDGTPRYVPANICDRIVGLHLVIAIQAALIHRQRTGEGQFVEVPMFETMAQFVLADHSGGRTFMPPIGDVGYKRLISQTRNPFATRDGYLAVAVYTDKHWRGFSRILGIDDLVVPGSIFADLPTRTIHSTEVGAFLADKFRDRTNAEWLAALDAADIPCGPVNAIDDLFTDPHLAAVGLFQTVAHPTEGEIVTTRFPVRFGASPVELTRMPPRLGEHGVVVAVENVAEC
jgi:crotonobetainyl-CoA:carnitine CoA-transferase CaiB-like acyl-CoA transferase